MRRTGQSETANSRYGLEILTMRSRLSSIRVTRPSGSRFGRPHCLEFNVDLEIGAVSTDESTVPFEPSVRAAPRRRPRQIIQRATNQKGEYFYGFRQRT